MSEKREAESVLSQDERVMAALAHIGVIWPTVGLVAPLVIWATQREKSSFVGFQALQAAAYQLILIAGSVIASMFYACGILSFPLSLGLAAPFAEGWSPGIACIPFLALLGAFGIIGLWALLWLAYLGYGVYGAVSALQGEDFRYVVIGPWMERYLGQG